MEHGLCQSTGSENVFMSNTCTQVGVLTLQDLVSVIFLHMGDELCTKGYFAVDYHCLMTLGALSANFVIAQSYSTTDRIP